MGATGWPVRPRVYRWPDAERGPYSLRLTSALIDGRPQIVGVELWGEDPANYPDSDRQALPVPESETGITSVAIRLPLGELLARVLDDYSHDSGLIGKAASASDRLRASVETNQATVDTAPVRRGRRPLYGVPHFARVARVYTDAMARGKRPTAAVAAWASVNKSTAAKWVARARALGLLPPTSRGRPAVMTEERREQR